MTMSTGDDSIRIFLIEEETIVRTALQTLLDSWEGFRVVGGSATKGAALEFLPSLDPHVVLVSLRRHDDADREVIRGVAAAAKPARVLALVGECDEQFRIQAVRQGAQGVVFRNKAAGELRKAIQKVSESDEIWLDRATLGRLIMQVRSPGMENKQGGLLALLTEREQDVVDLVIRGLKNQEIGNRLFISETTVRHHLTTVFNKLGMSSRFELIAYAHGHQSPQALEVRAPATPQPC